MAVLRARLIARLLLALAALPAAAPAARAQDLETEVRAVYLYNFARYFEWPARAFPTAETPIRICVQGSDAFAAALERAVAGERVNGRRIEAVRLPASANRRGCHLLYLSATGSGRIAASLDPLRGQPLLTVGEDDRFLELGGMIRFRRIDNRVRFDINLGAVQQSGLSVSARLLGVAAEVKREWRP